MKIHVLPAGPLQTNGYLLTEPKTGEAVLVDAPLGITEVIRPILAKEGCKLTALWLTHGHFDHMQDAARLKRELGARVLAHRDDQGLIETPEIMEGFMGAKLGLEGVKVDQWVAQGESIEALGRSFEVRHVPGHCPGNVLFYLPANGSTGPTAGAAIVGDALFNGGVGRWDLPGGSFEQLAASIRSQIYTLPDDTVVLPGHGPRTTVGDEKEGNPFVAALAR
ncbi:MAG: MBL fold metallo-hydrolase [Opitutus sp.]|nr:MBL fold metallo-hydrolase [Opitutus sp.]